MLALNPSDNQGVRYALTTCLLEERTQQALFGRMLVEPEVIRMLIFGFALVLVML